VNNEDYIELKKERKRETETENEICFQQLSNQ